MTDLITQKEVTFSSFRMTRMGLEPIGEPTFDQWIRCGEFIKNANGAVHFWIGDWMNYGEQKWGEMYTQAIDETGYSYGTLANDKWVASRVDPSRRREHLSFAHHQEVADLMPEDQEELLKVAEDQKLNSKTFRTFVRSYKMHLDLPELTAEQLKRTNQEDFKKAQGYVMTLIETVEQIVAINLVDMDVDARDFLVSQIKKSIGKLGKVVSI